MRPLLKLRWIILAILLWLWPVEKPSEEEYISYLREQERNKPDPLKSPEYVEMIRTQKIAAINAETARELQRYIDEHKPQSGHYEMPEHVTEPHRFHAHHLQRIETEEMRVAFPVRDTDKRLVR